MGDRDTTDAAVGDAMYGQYEWTDALNGLDYKIENGRVLVRDSSKGWMPSYHPEPVLRLQLVRLASGRVYDDLIKTVVRLEAKLARVQNEAVEACHDLAAELDVARNKAEKLEAWRPIETAPRDGTEILVCRAVDADGKPITGPDWGIFVQRAAWWGEGDNGKWTVYSSLPDEPRLFFEPTHWMPLPALPGASGEREGQDHTPNKV